MWGTQVDPALLVLTLLLHGACGAGLCECLPSWEYGGLAYASCASTPMSSAVDFPTWCKVAAACNESHARIAFPGTAGEFLYVGCNDNVDPGVECRCASECMNEIVGYCSVADAPCRSTPAGSNGNSAFMRCTPEECTCKKHWSFGGVQYANCSTALPNTALPGHEAACAVSGDACAAAVGVADPANPGFFVALTGCVQPDACACLASWEYE
eukprot:gene15164-23161_t